MNPADLVTISDFIAGQWALLICGAVFLLDALMAIRAGVRVGEWMYDSRQSQRTT